MEESNRKVELRSKKVGDVVYRIVRENLLTVKVEQRAARGGGGQGGGEGREWYFSDVPGGRPHSCLSMLVVLVPPILSVSCLEFHVLKHHKSRGHAVVLCM